ncbi:glycerophosphodiester phosphodiesterase [Prauserella sp. PE36]|uniref:glycerophosphodiester phosphodiesterase n=1 Tax=Prauserella sp. PE36 TaxID=1504709 RepID=UPI000D9D2B46|nr:glycerophosphodiester phosphodiesterase [Prauserella sp. PE36]PXY34590.1 glycerophosphodiester phosphodiesterase [Prauserella coralliicola]RBM12955.1 glycerophosphodiester phosphodiesterase [Prauserella sp. PE36]
MLRQRLALVALSALAVFGTTSVASTAQAASDGAVRAGKGQDEPVVVAHRGASGYRPEHTLAAYELGARMGADFIEPDLVITKDGVLVARHEPEIGGTTDVAERPEFADRKTTKVLDGTPVTGWFAEDFTLAELKTLRAKERIPDLRPNNTIYDGRFEVPTLQEVIDLAKRLSRELGREIGVYPETKHPTYFQQAGLPLEPPLVRTLERNGLNRKSAKVIVQSFEVANLKQLSKQLRVPLVQLVDSSGAPYDFVASGDPRTYDDLLTPKGLREVATYADGLGPAKDRVIPRDENGYLLEPTTLVGDAHRAGLTVHPFTFRAENNFLPADFRSSDNPAEWGDIFAEYKAFLATGIDGLFADHPDIAVEAARAVSSGR